MKRLRFALALLAVVVSASSLRAEPPAAPTVSIVSPKSGDVAGPVAMEAKLDGALPEGGGVQFLLDGLPLCGPILQPPFTLAWHTAHVWGCEAALEAVVVNGKGETVAKSRPVRLRIDSGFGGSITLEGGGLSRPLSGTVTMKIQTHIDRSPVTSAPPDRSVEAILVFIDGVQQALEFRDSVELKLDTTRLPDGPHELFAWAVLRRPDRNAPQYCTMIRRQFVTENKTPAVYAEPKFNRVYLAPGETIDLNPVYAGSPTGAALPSSVSCGPVADTAVATVDDKGVVKAVAPGVTTVTVKGPFRDGSSEKKILVIVDTPHGFPHFGKDGSMLSEYDPRKSLWVRAVFGLGGRELDSVEGLPAAVKASGVNVLTEGFYTNPVHSGNTTDFDAWHKSWTTNWARTVAWSEKYDMPMLLTGDDVARTTPELDSSVNMAWGPRAVKTAFEAAVASKRVVAIEMIDEVSFCWGDTPVPTDGRWKERTPSIDDDAFVKLMESINAVKGRPGITWPIGGISSHQASTAWMGDKRFSDYATIYWDFLAWRRAYPDGPSFPQYVDAFKRCVDDRLYGLQRDKPMLLLASGNGWFYIKQADEGEQFTIGRDKPHGEPSIPIRPQTASVLMYAPAVGMSGVRIYNFDTLMWKRQRAQAKAGKSHLQTGAEPFEVGTDRWAAITAAFRLIEQLEPFMLQPLTHAPYLGEGIFTGARKGKDGEMTIAINFVQGERTIPNLPLPFDKASDSSDTAVRRLRASDVVYRVHGMTLRTEPYDGGPLTLKPGEAVVRVAPKKDDKHVFVNGVTCAFAAPLTDAHVHGKVTVVVKARNISGGDVKVEIFADRVALDGVKKTDRGYEVEWDASKAKPNVWHILSAVATDADGNKSEARTAVFVREQPKEEPKKE
ncbi:MAG: Ig-like domain-containing protein [Phycisphaerae bacterium]|nr:Ig-like domain-containing protein [Phycisphaerae bacterium]